MIEQAVILAGGRGTRIMDLAGSVPKPMLKMAGKPLLEHQLSMIRRHGIRRVLILVCHRAAPIIDHFGDGSKWDVSIRYLREKTPLGTAGAVLAAYDELAERFFVLYGDTAVNVDLDRMAAAHGSSGADVTLLVHPNDHPADSDIVEIDDDEWIRRIHPYPRSGSVWLPNLVSAALYLVEKSVLASRQESGMVGDLAKDTFPLLLEEGRRLKAYRTPEYIKDVGTRDRFEEVSRDFANGRVKRGSLATPKPAVFLDRDGTLVRETDGLTDPDQLQILPGSAKGLRRLNTSDYCAVLVTNQPVIAKGQCSEDDLRAVHNKLESLLGREGAYLDRILYCPHHPERGFPGERRELKIACRCRKPGTAMVDSVVREWNVSRSDSWMIGDSTTDMLTARNAELRAVLVRTGHRGLNGKHAAAPDFEFFDLCEAVSFILDTFAQAKRLCRGWAEGVSSGGRIIIGGAARAGKSLLAGIMKEALAEAGLSSRILRLDAWIVDCRDRSEHGTVRDRFDYAAIVAFLREVDARRGVPVPIPGYDRYSGHKSAPGTFLLEPDGVLIVEGVPALDVTRDERAESLRIYVSMAEPRRKELFFREYEARGRARTDVEALYERRRHDEAPIVEETASLADVAWENST